MNQQLINEIEEYVSSFLNEKLPEDYVYHDLSHTQEVVQACLELGAAAQLSDTELETLAIAAWFHDIGYTEGPARHEARSVEQARHFLLEKKYDPKQLDDIAACIMATQVPQQPANFLQQIICDADLAHLGKEMYWDMCRRVRQEIMTVHKKILTEEEWLDFELDFMQRHTYHTALARDAYGKQKARHIKQLRKLKAQLFPDSEDAAEIKQQKKKKLQEKIDAAVSELHEKIENKELKLGRGVETMYRTTYNTHINLSAIADSKANTMLSVNGLIISIVVSTLVPKFGDSPRLIIPTLFLLGVCLCTIVYATLSTRPKITKGNTTREQIMQRKSNLLFFGNYYSMPLDDFQWGMLEMIKDRDFLYSSMARDLYFLAIVLDKKYRYLRICYTIFMYGLIAVVLVFAGAFIFF